MRSPALFRYGLAAGSGFARRLGLLLLLVVSGARGTWGQSFLHASGPKIVNASDQEVLLNGVNLGGWLLQEGYIIKPGWPGINGRQTQGAVKQTLYQAGLSDAAVETFYQGYRDNFITKPDIDYIAARGFNCVRLPLHYELFLTPAQRAVRNGVLRGTTTYAAYVSALTGWYNDNQLFTDPASLEAVRQIDNLLSWCAANELYVILDLHAAPGSQGTDANIADALMPLDFWTRPIYQDITNRLWATIAARYKNDARVAMYDLINEPNSVPSNAQIHDVLQRLINTVRAQGDNHLLLLEGNGYGNDFNYLEKRTFTNPANLVYNSHRYSGTGYLLDNNINSTEPNAANSLRTIGNLTRFRTDNDAPIWVGETGENSDAWMQEAAKNLNSVGIGWCHWTYKRFEDRNNAALLRSNPPYLVDGPAGLSQVLENIRFANCVPNTTVGAVAPNQNGLVNYPDGGNYGGTTRAPTPAPVGATIWLQGNNDRYVSSESGAPAMTCTRPAYGPAELFVVEAAGGTRISLRSLGRYVSAEGGPAALTCSKTAVSDLEKFEWIGITGNLVALRGPANRYVSSENGTKPMSCNRLTIDNTEVFRYGTVAALASAPARPATTGFYPSPVADRLTYELPATVKAHTLTVLDAAGRVVLTRRADGAGPAHTLDVSSLPAGIYLVRLVSPSFTTQFKISKQ